MKIGIIDCDSKNAKKPFPNLALMKLSAWHKQQGDSVEWYDAMFSGHMDKVYVSKVFSFSPDFEYFIDADEIKYGGSGFAISVINGKEHYDICKDDNLPYEVEHTFPDYALYGITDTAYGFLSRGCPRGCNFCHVAAKEGRQSRKVADLNEFWNGQKNICVCDPNILACDQCEDLLYQLVESNAYVDFNQGLDIRLMTERKAEILKKIKVKAVHFAFDRYEDKEIVTNKLTTFKDVTDWDRHKVSVYVLCGFKEKRLLPEDIERVMFIRSLDFQPYVMIYDKEHTKSHSELRRFQRWVNSPFIFWKCETFDEYKQQTKRKEF